VDVDMVVNGGVRMREGEIGVGRWGGSVCGGVGRGSAVVLSYRRDILRTLKRESGKQCSDRQGGRKRDKRKER